jgi:ureidoglycolate lyase
MSEKKLVPAPLDANAFAPFGDVIEVENAAEHRRINYGHTTRYHDLASLDVNGDQGKAIVSIFRSTPLPRPIGIAVMERHLLSSQAFYPLSRNPYLVVVAPPGDFDASAMQAFLAQPKQGVNYHAGVWHHYSLALEEISDFLVIDREGPGENCDEVFLNDGEFSIDY